MTLTEYVSNVEVLRKIRTSKLIRTIRVRHLKFLRQSEKWTLRISYPQAIEKARANQRLIHLTSLCEQFAEQCQSGVVNGQMLLDKKLQRATIGHNLIALQTVVKQPTVIRKVACIYQVQMQLAHKQKWSYSFRLNLALQYFITVNENVDLFSSFILLGISQHKETAI